MAICMFIGRSNIYDTDIEERIYKAITKIIKENDEIEFLFSQPGNYFSLCFKAAAAAKRLYPSKKIILTHTIRTGSYDTEVLKAARQELSENPQNDLDRIIESPIVNSHISQNNMREYYKHIRWMIDQSKYVISYVYREFYGSENQWLKHAKVNKKTSILDITSDETREHIISCAEYLTERESFIFEKLNDGYTTISIGSELGVSPERVRQVMRNGARKLHRHTILRLPYEKRVTIYEDAPFDYISSFERRYSAAVLRGQMEHELELKRH